MNYINVILLIFSIPACSLPNNFRFCKAQGTRTTLWVTELLLFCCMPIYKNLALTDYILLEIVSGIPGGRIWVGCGSITFFAAKPPKFTSLFHSYHHFNWRFHHRFLLLAPSPPKQSHFNQNYSLKQWFLNNLFLFLRPIYSTSF